MTFDRRAQVAGHGLSTTLSSAAHGGQVRLARRWSRSDRVIGAAMVIAGSAIGGALAVRGDPASAPASIPGAPADLTASSARSRFASAPPAAERSAAASSSPASGAATAATAPAASPPSPVAADPRAVAQIKAAVLRFLLWSHDHPGARCPDAAALGAGALDPWGRALRILCADQPADQIAGVLSLGPDGLPGTSDDIASWTLDPEVTDLLRGPRWSSRRSAAASAGARHPAGPAPHAAGATGAQPPAAATPLPTPAATRSPATAPSTKPSSTGAGSNDTDWSGIPDRR